MVQSLEMCRPSRIMLLNSSGIILLYLYLNVCFSQSFSFVKGPFAQCKREFYSILSVILILTVQTFCFRRMWMGAWFQLWIMPLQPVQQVYDSRVIWRGTGKGDESPIPFLNFLPEISLFAHCHHVPAIQARAVKVLRRFFLVLFASLLQMKLHSQTRAV